MREIDFDMIFADMVDANAEAKAFVASLREIMVDVFFQLCTKDGKVLAQDPTWEIVVDIKDIILEQAGKNQFFVGIKLNDREWLYARMIDNFDAVLLCKFHDLDFNFVQKKYGRDLLQSTVDHALLKQDYYELTIGKEQCFRQIDTLKHHHGKLIDSNYRQYRRAQEKEKKYAQKLEDEIVLRTAELRKKNIHLEKFSRLQSDFLAKMSHELRTPMNAIIGFTYLMADTMLNDEQTEYIKIIDQSAVSLLALINDILDLAKIESGKLDIASKPFNLLDVINNVLAMFKILAAHKKVDLVSDFDPQLPIVVIGDGDRLKQVLVNLVGNAVKFTEKGTVALRVEQVEQTTFGLLICFRIQDTGVGIAAARQQAVFNKFIQADGSTTRQYGGTGLGLTISQQLVAMMGGERIALSSTVGKGSDFSFTIPLKPVMLSTKAVSGRLNEHKIKKQSKIKKTIQRGNVLLVEDNPVNQRLATIMVSKQGYNVEVAADGLEALEQIRKKKFDMILMDIQMPNMDGMTATRKIRELEDNPGLSKQYASLNGRETPLPIIGLTAHVRKKDKQACYDIGMNGFLTKPIVRDKLLTTLLAVMSNECR